MPTDVSFTSLVEVIVADDRPRASYLLHSSPQLARAQLEVGASRQRARDYYIAEVDHYLYAGDTPLHVAAAAYRAALVPVLVAAGADVHARNRRGAQPLHYAADGVPGSTRWDPVAQADTVRALLAAGADPDQVDNSGVTPLHRAVRNRCAAAVRALLEGGADPNQPNRSGSSPMKLATTVTGRGGSGSEMARAQQAEIVSLLEASGATN